MLSVQEEDYVRSIINTYKKQGYDYYLCYTNSDSNVSIDIYLYFSKEEIKALDNNIFSIKNGINVNIDTSYRYNDKPNVLTMFKDIENNTIVIDKTEYVYSNCSYNYNAATDVIYPDILLSQGDSFNSMYLVNFLLISIFLYLFVKSILRIRR